MAYSYVNTSENCENEKFCGIVYDIEQSNIKWKIWGIFGGKFACLRFVMSRRFLANQCPEFTNTIYNYTYKRVVVRKFESSNIIGR